VTLVSDHCLPFPFHNPPREGVNSQCRRRDQHHIDILKYAIGIGERNAPLRDIPLSKTLSLFPTFVPLVVLIRWRRLTEVIIIQGVEPRLNERRIENHEKAKIAGRVLCTRSVRLV